MPTSALPATAIRRSAAPAASWCRTRSIWRASVPPAARPPENPQFDLVPHRFGRRNVVPSFMQQYGPIREVRFVWKVDGNGDFIRDNQGQLIPDGGVHQLWTVRGDRTDRTIPNCAIVQPDFEKQLRQNNIAFRIPLQMTGLGLIELIQDREILARQAATASQRAALGIKGRPNRSGNDGTITRFGWKAQNKSLVIFAGEAYNVEQGITNEVFPQPTEEDPACNGPGKPAPNDVTRMDVNRRRQPGLQQPHPHHGRLDAVHAADALHRRPAAGGQHEPERAARQAGVRRRRLRAVPHARPCRPRLR